MWFPIVIYVCFMAGLILAATLAGKEEETSVLEQIETDTFDTLEVK